MCFTGRLRTVQVNCNFDGRMRHLNVEVASGKTSTVQIDFPPLTATLEGRIILEDGSSPESATVTLFAVTSLGNEVTYVESDPKGFYRLDGLPEGPVEVMLRVGEEIPIKLPVLLEIEPGTAMLHDIHVVDGIPIGIPVDNEKVQVGIVRER
jgi:hypothetical protein